VVYRGIYWVFPYSFEPSAQIQPRADSRKLADARASSTFKCLDARVQPEGREAVVSGFLEIGWRRIVVTAGIQLDR
jgi:hypothetical protein